MQRRSVLTLGLGAACALALPAGAQNFGTVQSPVLTIDSDELYVRSAFGRRIAAEVTAASTELAAQNRAIETELTDEEKSLTDQRPTLEPTEFRALADAFDQKVRRIRREQDTKASALGRKQEEGEAGFLRAAAPVLEEMMREAGAAVVLERRNVFLSLNAIDITEAAIARIDDTIGDGTAPQD
jgi:Skp family chaperone for outer membrane proteins